MSKQFTDRQMNYLMTRTKYYRNEKFSPWKALNYLVSGPRLWRGHYTAPSTSISDNVISSTSEPACGTVTVTVTTLSSQAATAAQAAAAEMASKKSKSLYMELQRRTQRRTTRSQQVRDVFVCR